MPTSAAFKLLATSPQTAAKAYTIIAADDGYKVKGRGDLLQKTSLDQPAVRIPLKGKEFDISEAVSKKTLALFMKSHEMYLPESFKEFYESKIAQTPAAKNKLDVKGTTLGG